MDNVVYLARCIPRMCLPADHPWFEWSHDVVLDYVCDTANREYENTILPCPTEDDNTFAVMYVHGKDLRAKYPMVDTALKHLFSFDPIRPMATYAVVFVRLEDGELR